MFKKVFAISAISTGIAIHLKNINKDKKFIDYCPVRYIKKHKEQNRKCPVRQKYREPTKCEKSE